MKALFVCMGFYLLYLFCIPCKDGQDGIEQTAGEVAAATHQDLHNKNEDHNHNQEACTPFCTCSCCATSAFYIPMLKMQPAKISAPAQKHPLYNIVFHTDVYRSIWQPPRIA